MIIPEGLNRGPKWFRKWSKEIAKAIRQRTPLGGINTTRQDSENGVAINASGGGGEIAKTTGLNSFAVLVRNFGTDEEPDWKRGVIPGRLQKTKSDADEIDVTGCLASEDPEDDDPGWVATGDGDRIWIQGQISAGLWPEVMAAYIHSDSVDDDFDGGEIEHDGGDSGDPEEFAQFYFRKVLAVVELDETGDVPTLAVRQRTLTNFFLEQTYEDAKDSDGEDVHSVPAVYPYAL